MTLRSGLCVNGADRWYVLLTWCRFSSLTQCRHKVSGNGGRLQLPTSIFGIIDTIYGLTESKIEPLEQTAEMRTGTFHSWSVCIRAVFARWNHSHEHRRITPFNPVRRERAKERGIEREHWPWASDILFTGYNYDGWPHCMTRLLTQTWRKMRNKTDGFSQPFPSFTYFHPLPTF